MIFKIGDKVKCACGNGVERSNGTVLDVLSDRNTVIVDFDDRVVECAESSVSIDYDAVRTKFDEEGPLFDYNEGAKSQYHDEHYSAMAIQPIELMQRVLTPAEFKGFLRGNIIKYTMRAGHKLGESRDKDLDKANRYRDWLYECEAGLTINPRE